MTVTLTLPEEVVERAKAIAKARGTDINALALEAFLQLLQDDQEWYWSPEWQAQERKAENELATGDYQKFDSMDDFLSDLMANE